MIGVFTPEIQSGILQLGLQIVKSLMKNDHDAVLIVPEQALCNCPKSLLPSIRAYSGRHSFNLSNNQSREIEGIIRGNDVRHLIITIPGIHGIKVASRIATRCTITTIVHDASPHSTNSLKKRTLAAFLSRANRLLYKKSNSIVLLSSNSLRTFRNKYPNFSDKAKMVLLGAHVPEVDRGVPPQELSRNHIQNFVLFFGRIDRQKGIDRLLRSMKERPLQGTKLVIAGKGAFSDEEKKLIEGNSQVLVINRFIEDSEMVWLFERSKCVVLPYRDATQSGVIPVSYYCGKPVVASDIEGLNEFVAVGSTGFLVGNELDFSDFINRVVLLEDEEYRRISGNCSRYYSECLNWDNNIGKLLVG